MFPSSYRPQIYIMRRGTQCKLTEGSRCISKSKKHYIFDAFSDKKALNSRCIFRQKGTVFPMHIQAKKHCIPDAYSGIKALNPRCISKSKKHGIFDAYSGKKARYSRCIFRHKSTESSVHYQAKSTVFPVHIQAKRH